MRTLLFAFLIPVSCFSQQQYRLKFAIDGWKDTTVYLAYYWSERTYVQDTATVDHRGNFLFDGKGPLPQGVYLLILNRQRIFDFVIGKNQDFSISTSSSDYAHHLKTNDPDNRLFFENMRYAIERHQLASDLEDATITEDEKKRIGDKLALVDKAISDFQLDLVRKNPATVTARILAASKPPDIPVAPRRADGSVDSTFQLRWYRAHYFDHFNLADDALIRMPGKMYQQKIHDYLDRLFVPHPDSLEAPIRRIISLAKSNPDTYKYIVWQLMVKYHEHAIMGLDEVYVDLFDDYFASGEMNFWVSDKMMKNIRDEADRMRRSLVGRTGANLIMLDADFAPRSMYDISNKYTILFIFDPNCSSCKQETPKLVNFYKQKKFDLEVYAVSLDTSMNKMRDMIAKMNMEWITVNGPRTYVGPVQNLYDAPRTPSLYILDRQKKIIAKKLPVSQVEEFLTGYESREKARAGFR